MYKIYIYIFHYYYSLFLFQAGFIKHTVNKSTFSEQCYYTFGDIAAALANCNLKVKYKLSRKQPQVYILDKKYSSFKIFKFC